MKYYSIYQEQIYDLFSQSYDDRRKKHKYECQEIEIATINQFQQHFTNAENLREFGTTSMNQESSRSHAIIEVAIVVPLETNNRTQIKNQISNVVLVDLAGSEDVEEEESKSKQIFQSDRKQLQQSKEGNSINLSLYNFNKIITQLNHDQKFISYRDCGLTYCLKSYLQQSSLISFIFTINQEIINLKHSLRTLNFSQSVSGIKQQALKNQQSLNELDLNHTNVKTLHDEYLIMKNENQQLHIENQNLKTEKTNMMNQIESQNNQIESLMKELQGFKAQNMSQKDEEESGIQNYNSNSEFENYNDLQKIDFDKRRLELWDKDSRNRSKKKLESLRSKNILQQQKIQERVPEEQLIREKENTEDQQIQEMVMNQFKDITQIDFQKQDYYSMFEKLKVPQIKQLIQPPKEKYQKNPFIIISDELIQQEILRFMFLKYQFQIDGIILYQNKFKSILVLHFNERPQIYVSQIQDWKKYLIIDQSINKKDIDFLGKYLMIKIHSGYCTKLFDLKSENKDHKLTAKILEYSSQEDTNQETKQNLKNQLEIYMGQQNKKKTFQMLFCEQDAQIKFLFYLNQEKKFIDDIYFQTLGNFSLKILDNSLEFNQIKSQYHLNQNAKVYEWINNKLQECFLKQ
ncbi:hypothetical protein pb186bvf_018236 [Paramecium bursaria]